MAIGKISHSILPGILIPFIFTLHFCYAEETITPTQFIRDPETITSSNGTFRLGFFSPDNSSNRYVGIWYNKIAGDRTIVWVANGDVPLKDTSGVFTIGEDRNLVVLDGERTVLWSTNVTDIKLTSHAELLDSGDLVLREGNSSNRNVSGRIIWESFKRPSNTILPSMWLGVRTGEKQVVRSWKDDKDPSLGSFSVELDPATIPQILIRNGSNRHWRSGPWNGRVFIGVQEMHQVYLNGFNLARDDQESSMYMTFSNVNKSVLAMYVLNSQGMFAEKRWHEGDKQWVEEWSAPRTECEVYGKCGSFGYCNTLNSPICICLSGFEPKSIEEWSKGNWSGGCVRKKPLQCEKNHTTVDKAKPDRFFKLGNMKMPDFVSSIGGWDVKSCEERCLLNCSCTAYSYDSGTGCLFWTGNLIDIQKLSEGGLDLFIRDTYFKPDQKKTKKVIIITTVLAVVITSSALAFLSWRWMTKQRGRKRKSMENLFFENSEDNAEYSKSNKLSDNRELPIFSFEKLVIATNNFVSTNRLGEGGFGPVYKGKLPDGQEIAVKRLSRSSGQGSEEFKNEVMVISNLQHRNLVRLLGCCIKGEEKMLIYEYMPNKSLDTFIFGSDPGKQAILDWRKRFNIIMGVARGILYLHRDSRLRVIHRDLKASNVLLDEELHPKISDFGMARIFGSNEHQANTMRVVGTYGYMAPEYAMNGIFSEKSDVFSFGVLLIELVSGKKNTTVYHHARSWSLLGYAWEVWNEGKTHELIDPVLLESSSVEEILRCIHVGLLCVQDFAKDRPTMSSILSMLNSDISSLPTPKQPTFSGGPAPSDSESSKENYNTCSKNYISITTVEGR